MKTLIAAFFSFLLLGAMHCDKPDATTGRITDHCHYKGHAIQNGEFKSLQVPCVQVSCTSGKVKVLHCLPRQLLAKDKRCFKHPGEAAPYPSCCPTFACV
uniref:Single domain-containing protein n=1 Tax=Amblyomma maculatum TaxID=34609 RepID=G3MTI1_AMBMU